MSVLAYVARSDDRLAGRVFSWRPPRWFRVWMLWTSRLGDGWLWLGVVLGLVAVGPEGTPVLAPAAVSAGCANLLQILVKASVRRARPCERRHPAAFVPNPLGWFPSDRFSFPSGHALNAFAIASVVALAFPPLAAPVLALAASVAASRVVLGLHWLSDVLAGSVVGGLIGATTWVLLVR